MTTRILDIGTKRPSFALLLYALAYALILISGSMDGTAFTAIADIGSTIPPFIAAGLAFGAWRNSIGPTRTSWLFIGLAMLAWGIGEATWLLYEVALGQETPFPSIADAGYLTFYPLMLLGILTLSSPGNNRRRF